MYKLVKTLARTLLGEYSAYYIYSSAPLAKQLVRSGDISALTVALVDKDTIASSKDPLIREQAVYACLGSYAYACFNQDRIVGVCFYWFGDRYRQRNFWPLADGEAKLVQIISLPDMRGRGVATMLIERSYHDMAEKGFKKAYARIWHSNTPSVRAFERTGWKRISLVIEVNPFRRSRPVRICLPWKTMSLRMS